MAYTVLPDDDDDGDDNRNGFVFSSSLGFVFLFFGRSTRRLAPIFPIAFFLFPFRVYLEAQIDTMF